MNELKHVDEFRAALKDYQPSDAAKAILQSTELVLLVGPTSSGRNSIINELVKTGRYHYIVSDTTRQPRTNNGVPEETGREYWFRGEEEVLADLHAGKFLEAAIIHDQQVSGISIRELEHASQMGKIAINEVEIVGADNIHAAKPDGLFLFIVPPSFDEWMVRMSARGVLPPDEVRRRLESAVKEISTALERDYYIFIVNDTFAHTAKHIDDMAANKHVDKAVQAAARAVAQEVLEETKKHLRDKL